jgi:hypothetical protein
MMAECAGNQKRSAERGIVRNHCWRGLMAPVR